MTQIIIAGIEAVLPQNFAITVKRENPFFTKSGEYTYDCTLRLDNPTNQQLYGFLHRLNKTGQVATRRTAVLMADGHVYCRGTEVITKWTDQTVSIQVVSGESELNFFIGQEQKIDELNLGRLDDVQSLDELEDVWDDAHYGSIPTLHRTYGDSDYCLPTIKTPGKILNLMTHTTWSEPGQPSETVYRLYNATPQPYLCAILRRLMGALGYTVGDNQLEQTQFRNLFLVNTLPTLEYARMLAGWTVKDFLTEVERLTGAVFITDNTDPAHPTVDIVLKTVFYQDARELPLNNVVDEYETEVRDDESREEEFTASDVSYDLPDSPLSRLQRLPEGYLQQTGVITHHRMSDMLEDATQNPQALHKVEGDDRLYIVVTRDWWDGRHNTEVTCMAEVNQFCNLDRSGTDSTLTLKITPAPMGLLDVSRGEVIMLGDAEPTDDASTPADPEKPAEELIQDFTTEESKAGHIYCAFFNGFYVDFYNPLPYTDDYHAYMQELLYPGLFTTQGNDSPNPEGSLRLQDLDADHYQGGYQIDTAHAVTFQTFDPNRIDPRQVYVIQNRRYVVRDVEETVTAEGRAPLWKLTCYPINISDEAVENRWILTRGVWDDGAAWLDDGRWNDGSNE